MRFPKHALWPRRSVGILALFFFSTGCGLVGFGAEERPLSDAGSSGGGGLDGGNGVPDAAVTPDAATLSDAAMPLLDASTPPDASMPPDAAVAMDAAMRMDAAVPMDAAVAMDAAMPADAAIPFVDAGVVPGSRLVVVGYGGRRVSTANATDWAGFTELDPNGGDDDNLFRGVGYGAGVFVAVGGSANGFTMTSTDGVNWGNLSRTPTAWMGGVAYLNGNFVSAGGNGLRTRSTDMGLTWVDEVGYQAVHYRAVVAGNGVVVAAGHTYGGSPDTGVITTTSDGVQWSERYRQGDTLHSLAFGNGRFVAGGDGGNIQWSDDGISWNGVDVVGSGGVAVAFANGEFFANTSSGIYRSTNAESWTAIAGSTRSVDGYFNGVYLTLGWPADVATSTNFMQWNRVFYPMGSGLTSMVVGEVLP